MRIIVEEDGDLGMRNSDMVVTFSLSLSRRRCRRVRSSVAYHRVVPYEWAASCDRFESKKGEPRLDHVRVVRIESASDSTQCVSLINL